MKRLAWLVLVCLPGLAWGAAPYADWLFKVERASAAGDDAALTELAKDDPDLARIWFYGNVYDLGIAAIPDKEKKRIRRWAERFAEGLAAVDEEPLLILELPPEAMAKQLEAMQGLLEPALGDPEPTSAVIAGLERVNDEQVARAALNALLHRAHVAHPRLGGNQDARRLLEAARGLAEALSLVDGDLVPWRTIAAWQGGEGVTAERPPLIEERIMAGFNALLVGNAATGQTTLDDSVRALAGSNAPALRVSLMSLGAALAADVRGDIGTARALRQRVGAVVKVPWISAALARGALAGAVKQGDADGAVTAAAALDRTAAAVSLNIRDGEVRTAAVELWRAEAARRTAAGQLEAAERLLVAARAVADHLKEAGTLEATVPAGRRAAEGRTRVGRAAEVAQLLGRLALRRGAFDTAADAFAATRERALEAQDPGLAGRAAAARAQALVAAGKLDDALAAASAGCQGTTGVDLAEALAMRAEVRLWRGELAPAFSNANEGLRALKGLDAEALRGRLHLLAAAALEADGQARAATERLQFAARGASTPEVAVALATQLAAEGKPAEARLALLPHITHPEAAAADGCLAARSGVADEAEARLAPLLGSGDVDLAVRAAGCLLRVRRDKAAKDLVARFEPLLAQADPLESAAFLVAASLVEPNPTRREAALRDWQLGRGDGHGRSLLIKRIAAFDDPGPAIRAGLEAAFRRNAATEAWLPEAVWWQRQALALAGGPPRPGVDVPGEALRTVRGPLARIWSLGRVIADPAVEAAARPPLTTARAAALGELATALASLRGTGSQWVARSLPAWPQPAEFAPDSSRVRVWYVTGAAGGRVVAALPTGTRTDRLPPEAELRGLVEQAPGDEKKRRQLAAVLLPFAAALAADALPLEVEADGVLALFPLGRLLPGRPVLHRLGLPVPPGAPAASVAVVPCAAEGECPAEASIGAPAQRAAWATALGRVHFAGEVTADGLAAGDTRVPISQLVRTDGRVTEVAIAQRSVDGDSARRVAAGLVMGGARAVVLPATDGRFEPGDLWGRALGGTPRRVATWDQSRFVIADEVLTGPPRSLATVAAERPDVVVVVP